MRARGRAIAPEGARIVRDLLRMLRETETDGKRDVELTLKFAKVGARAQMSFRAQNVGIAGLTASVVMNTIIIEGTEQSITTT